ncbi:MAG: GNAT family N-acetyltransferase [Martelella sp.]|uniref:GNAT family N-acetyltransferase n=1 Tax=unclassified Martelella TaxID=2629616 RepID=UPI000C374B04|nr:GNAT family N-acetyltransferase [Martelella sp.]MAU23514.1 GNAT family N-acetyltransferase [Martelella sp.]|tara:strand:- start:1390 stop:1944 length:555 start_codon:yes stop_codon:yes gene_type:complete
MTIAETERLIIRNWEDRDRDLFHEINSDDTVMAFFPMRRTRAESDQLFDMIRAMIAETGYGFPAVELKENGEVIGFTGLNKVYSADIKPDGTPELGWRMTTRHWGKGYATEAARAMIALAFDERGHDQLVSFAVADNHRSTAVMERLGMERDLAGDFDHPSIPDSHPHLKRHVLYRLHKADWQG